MIHFVGRPLPDLLQSISTWTPSSTSTQTPSSFSFAGGESFGFCSKRFCGVSFEAERTGHLRRAKALRLRPLPSHQRQALEALGKSALCCMLFSGSARDGSASLRTVCRALESKSSCSRSRPSGLQAQRHSEGLRFGHQSPPGMETRKCFISGLWAQLVSGSACVMSYASNSVFSPEVSLSSSLSFSMTSPARQMLAEPNLLTQAA